MEILYKTLNTVVLDAALVAFILSAILVRRQYRNKVKASINLIHQYVMEAQNNIDERIKSYALMRKNIDKGNPYCEPANDYTPLLFYNKEYELSFEQISEILRHLSNEEQKRLLEYFAVQSMVDAVISGINTDYFRTMPQKRKADAFEILIDKTKVLKSVAVKLIKELNRWQA